MRLKQNDELSLYRKQIGDKAYRRQYETLYRFAEQSKRRHSGRDYTNSKERLSEIKDKYKDGVQMEHILAMLRK